MRIFIWEGVSNLTDNYHDGGGLVVVAESVERAWQLAPKGSDAVNRHPDRSFTLQEQAVEEAFIFPDAGCC